MVIQTNPEKFPRNIAGNYSKNLPEDPLIKVTRFGPKRVAADMEGNGEFDI